MRDFNVKIDSEVSSNESPVVENELELFKQELDVLFSTSKFDVLGDPSLGSNIENIIWKTSFDSNKIQSEIANSIRSSCFMHEFFEWSVNVKLYKGSIRDIAVIDVNIKVDKSSTINQQYVFK